MGLNKTITYSMVFIIIIISAGYFIYVNFIIPKDSRLLVKIIEGVKYQNIYDDEFTDSYNYTSLLTNNKQIWFNYSPTEDDYSKNGTSPETRLYTFQNISEIQDWIHSMNIPNVVKGVAETMVGMSISDLFRVVKNMSQPDYHSGVSILLGDRQFYHFMVTRGGGSDGSISFGISFYKTIFREDIWIIWCYKTPVDAYYTATMTVSLTK